METKVTCTYTVSVELKRNDDCFSLFIDGELQDHVYAVLDYDVEILLAKISSCISSHGPVDYFDYLPEGFEMV